jgi:hypothetical protein
VLSSAALNNVKETAEANPPTLNAHIRSGAQCGLGTENYVVNDLPNKDVNATVRTTRKYGTNTDTSDQVYTIPAGSETYLGCSLDPNATPVIYYTWEVIATVPQ